MIPSKKQFYRRKPTIVQAIQIAENNLLDLIDFIDGQSTIKNVQDIGRMMYTKSGGEVLKNGDWLVRNENGSVFVCKEDMFEFIYETVI